MKRNLMKTKGGLHYYLQSTSGVVGAILLAFMVIVSILAVFSWMPHDPLEQHVEFAMQGPNSHFWFGTDEFGRDIFSRTLDGMRRSLTVSISAVSIAAFFGVILGILSGYLGRWFDQLIVRLSDVIFAFPAILLALAIVSTLGNSWFDTSLAIAVVYTPIFIRVARGPVLTVKERSIT